MKKRLTAWVFVILLPLLSVITLASASSANLSALAKSLLSPEDTASRAEEIIKDNLPCAQGLRNMYIQLRVAGGNREFGDMVIAGDGLIKVFSPSSDTSIRRTNTNAILSFVESGDVPAYLMILPTASAIYQDQLPSYMSVYNEREYLEEVRRQVSGKINYVDSYLPLMYSADGYIYYRTDTRLTSLGQYVIYQALAPRLGFSPRGMSDFELCRMPGEYYGELYSKWDYGGIKGDVVTYYKYASDDRLYTVKLTDGDRTLIYGTMFPTQAASEGNAVSVILGRDAPMIDIQVTGASSAPALLVLGDGDSMGVLPFLALHYSRITFLDLSQLTDKEIADFSTEGYDHILFAYGLNSYMNSSAPARIALMNTGEK